MKSCELCKVPARTFCESDQASLCWDCDANVHGANFLVARHTRTLLCHACQSPTPWKGLRRQARNTVSLCEMCSGGTKVDGEESQGGNDDDIDTEDDDLDDGEDEEDIDDDDEDDEVGGDEDDEDGDNQVVPWSSTAPPPPAPSSSSSEESVSWCNPGDEVVSETISLKRRRHDEDHGFQKDSNGWACKRRYGGEWREEIGRLGCGGEPPSTQALSGGGEVRAAVLAIESFGGPWPTRWLLL